MKKILLLLLFTLSTFAGPGTFPQGDHIKQLKDKIEFKNSKTQLISNDSDDPSAVAKFGDAGSLYMRTNGSLYIKQDSGLTTNWSVIGGGNGFTSTGLKEGSALSVGGAVGTFSVAIGKAVVVDAVTDVDNVSFTDFAITAKVNVAVTGIAVQPVTYILMTSADTIIQQASFPTPSQRRDNVFLGVVVHSDNVNVNAINNLPDVAIDTNAQVHDLMNGIGTFNVSGNRITANGANLSIDKAAGVIFKEGVNFDVDPKNPHKRSLGSQSPVTFRYRNQDSSEGSDITVLDPTTYDASGVTTTVPSNNNATIQRVYMFPSGIIRVQRGQQVFANFSAAVVALGKESFITESNIEENGLLLASIVMKKNASSLENTSDTGIFTASRFGELGSGGSSATVNLTQAYQNSIDPEITLDSTRGTLQVVDAATPITGNLTEVTNNAQTTKFHEISTVRNSITDADSTFVVNPSYNIRNLENLKVNDAADLFPTLSANVAVADETVTPIDGFRSASLTQASAIATDSYTSKTFDVTKPIYKKGASAFLFDITTNAPPNSYSVELVVNDGSDRTISTQVLDETGTFEYSGDVTFLTADTTVYFVVTTIVPLDANELIIDNVRVDISGSKVKEFTTEQSYRLEQAGSATTDRFGEIEVNLATASIVKEGEDILVASDDSGSTRTRWTATRDCTVNFSMSIMSAIANRVATVGVNGVVLFVGSVGDVGSTVGRTTVTGPIKLKVGDFITGGMGLPSGAAFDAANAISNTSDLVIVGFTATAATSGTVHASNVSVTDIIVRGTGNGGGSVTAAVTDIDFTEVKDTNSAWSGTQFTVPETGIYSIDGYVATTTATQTRIGLYIGGTLAEHISNVNNTEDERVKFQTTREFTKDDVLSFRSALTKTLSNSATLHYINITKAAPKVDNFIIDLLPKSCLVLFSAGYSLSNKCSSWVASVAAGAVLTLNANAFTSTPNCLCTSDTGTVQACTINNSTATSTNIDVGLTTDETFTISCFGGN